MNKLNQKLELAANFLFIVVAVLLCAVIVQKYFSDNSTMNQQRAQPTIGKQVNLPNENWSAQPKTIVLALQTTCHFCNESAPFYKRLIESAKGKNIKFVAAFPQPVEESAAHLNQLGLAGLEVKQIPLSQLDASGTPTLILTNEKGEVTKQLDRRLSYKLLLRSRQYLSTLITKCLKQLIKQRAITELLFVFSLQLQT